MLLNISKANHLNFNAALLFFLPCSLKRASVAFHRSTKAEYFIKATFIRLLQQRLLAKLGFPSEIHSESSTAMTVLKSKVC